MAIELISKIKPKNNGSFALVDAEDVAVSANKRLSESLEEFANISELAQPINVDVSPTNQATGSLYSVPDKNIYGSDHAGWAYAEYAVTAGDTIYVTGKSASSGTVYPVCAFWDSQNGYRLSIYGSDANTGFSDEEITVPTNAVRMVVNSTDTTNYPISVKKSMSINERLESVSDAAETIGTMENRLQIAETRITHGFFPPDMDGLIKEAERDPFRFAPFDKGYVTFVWDDLRDVTDSIVSVFEEYNYPVCLAAIQARMGVVATGLSAARGSYTPGMYMYQICHKVEELGGEILAHNGTVITLQNQYDYDTMYDYFIYTYQRLHDHWGLNIRGLIRAGGTNQLGTSREIKRWVINQYEYSNMWSDDGWEDSTNPKDLYNHMIKRIDINSPLATVKAAIDSAYADKRWVVFFGHDYDYGGGQTLTGEADLREILDYVQAKGVTVTTYAHIFDYFSSSVLGERIRVLEGGS